MLKGKVAFITGGSMGIGRATALVLAEKGANICVVDVLPTEKTVQLAKETGRKALGIKADITNWQEITDAVKLALENFGRIDILCNIAGIANFPSLTFDLTEEEWDRTLNVNLKGTFLCTKAVLPTMIEQKYGRIVCLSSISGGLFGWPGWSHYAASKAGIVGFVKTVAQEVGPYGITINAIAPGIIETDLSEKAVGLAELKKTAKSVPLGRIGQPSDVAKVVAFFASDEAGYVTGQCILVDGGLSLGPAYE